MLQVGVRIGVEFPVKFGEDKKVGVQVKQHQIKLVIERLMNGGREAKQIRERVQKLGEKTERAMEEGGSSYLNMTLLLQDIMEHVCNAR